MIENYHYIGEIEAKEPIKKLDKINKKLLSMLMKNARLPYSFLAENVNLTKSNVRRRIRILEGTGVITGYHAYIDIKKLNLKSGLLLFQTKCTEDQKEEYIKNSAKNPWVYAVTELTGKFDLVITFYFKDENHKDEVVESLLKQGYTKNFTYFDTQTFFPILDYSTELFQQNEFPRIKGKDPAYVKISKKEKDAKIDSKDIKILKILSDNCRTSLIDISKKLDISRETVNYRIKKLVSSEIIAKFQPTINTFSLGFEGYFMFMKLSKPTQRKNIIEYLKQTHRCNTILKTKGEYDIFATIHFKSSKEFRAFENDLLKRFRDSIYEYFFEFGKHQEKLDWFPKEVEEYLLNHCSSL